MITREDVVHFYAKYKENLTREEQVNAELTNVSGQTEWIEKLKQKYRTMRQIYIENEAMLNLYVYPYLEGRTELTNDVAVEFVNQIRQAWREGYEDNVSMLEMGEVLAPYLQKHGPLDAYIWDISLLGILYNCCLEKEEGVKGYEYFKKVCDLSDHYFEIEDFAVRQRIIYAYYNRAILQVNFLLEDEETLLFNLEDAMRFYHDPRVLALDGGRFDFEGLAQELNYDVFGNYIISHTRENVARWFVERGEGVLRGYYERELAKDPNPYAMPDEIFCYYKRTLFYLGRISCTQYLSDYKAYCEYSLQHDALEHPGGYWESNLFHVAVNHIPGILECLNLYGSEYEGEPIDRSALVEGYLSVIRQMPHNVNSRFTDDAVQKSLHSLLQLMSEQDAEFDSLLNVMLNRDKTTLVHSLMVSRIAGLLLQEVFEKEPELLIGAQGCRNVVEVLESRDQLVSFVSHAAKLFDMGKLKDIDVVNKQSRELTVQELARIHEHPAIGAEMVRNSPTLKQFCDVIRGHHKSWDGLMGYPADFDNTASQDRFLIELIHLSDCMDAATDFIGRSYKVPKSLEEFMAELRQGRGTLYCPELVNLLLDSAALQERLRYLLNQGRYQIYCEVYGIDRSAAQETAAEQSKAADWYVRLENDVETEQDERDHLISVLHKSSETNANFVHAMVRHSLLTMYVDLRNGKYNVLSRGEQRLFGGIANGTYPEFLTRYLQKIVWPKDWEKIRYQLSLSEVIHTLVMQDGRFECEVRVRLNGSYRWAMLQFIQLDEKNIIPRTMAMIINDVQESHNRSDQMETVLKDAYRTAMDANKAKTVFLSSMSHDIRTPMNGIMGMVKIAKENLEDMHRVADCLHKIETSSAYLMRLLNEVMDMSNIESGKTILHEEPTLLADLMLEVLDACRPEIIAARHELVTDLAALDGACVMADPVRLRQVFTNIVSNAVQYTRDGGRIRVLAKCLSEDREKGNCYQICVQDNGIGMSEEFKQKLFEPFAREDNSMTNVRQGTGLGLSIAKSMIAKMGGTIDVDSVQGQGTTVTVTLQLLPTVQAAPPDPAQEENARFDGHRILLVEDNELNREIACELLQERGLTVETAYDGVEAVECFKNKPQGYYELIFMDIQMPRMNGYNATKAIRAIPNMYAKTIPIVALTANVLPEDATQAMESGMNAHITKPIDMDMISKTLLKWLP